MLRCSMLIGLLILGTGCTPTPATEANEPSPTTATEPDDPSPATTSLFDGKTLDGWSGDPALWSVEAGEMVGRTTAENPAPHNTFLVWQGGDVVDFDVVVEVRLIGPNNSGIQYRSEMFGDHRVRGYQCDIHENSEFLAMLYEEGGRGIVARRGERITLASDGSRVEDAEQAVVERIDVSAWHEYRIIARGSRIEHRIDGEVACVVDDLDPERSRGSGVLAVQLHDGAPYEVRIRSVRLTVLK